jgi:acetyl-CoA acetyltransferase family protein
MSIPTARAAATRLASRAVFVDGVRTPFALSGGAYANLMAVDLARSALRGLVAKTALDPARLDSVVLGTVIQEVRTSNIAREAALSAGIPDSVPAHTVTMACISSNAAAASAAAHINAGLMESCIVGGAETMSDVPIRISKPLRQRMLKGQKAKGPADYLRLLAGLSPKDFVPEAPAIAEFSTGEVMGHSSDRLAARWGASRRDQDEFALRSHLNAARATKEGLLAPELVPTAGLLADNGIKADSTLEKLSSLRPAFVRPHGTHTAGNSSFLTDGASAALIMSEEAALRAGFTPKTRLADWIFVSQDPRDELLLGPAYAIARLLARNSLDLNDVAVFELHEAFAGQVLANINALDSEVFRGKNLGWTGGGTVGRVPMERVNTLGGSLAIGHPFGATGTRLITTASNRLLRGEGGGGKYAVLAACAAGGQGHAMLLERYEGGGAQGKK